MQYLDVVTLSKHEMQYGQHIESEFLFDDDTVVEKSYDKIGNIWFDQELNAISTRTLIMELTNLQDEAKLYRICIFRCGEDTEKYLWHMLSNISENDESTTPYKIAYNKEESQCIENPLDISCEPEEEGEEYVLHKQELEELRDILCYVECINDSCKNLKRLLKL